MVRGGIPAMARPGRGREPGGGFRQWPAAPNPLESAVPHGGRTGAEGGGNSLSIAVTNLWVNRLIGDHQPGAAQKYTFTTQRFYRASSPLKPSGLLGPEHVVERSRGVSG